MRSNALIVAALGATIVVVIWLAFNERAHREADLAAISRQVAAIAANRDEPPAATTGATSPPEIVQPQLGPRIIHRQPDPPAASGKLGEAGVPPQVAAAAQLNEMRDALEISFLQDPAPSAEEAEADRDGLRRAEQNLPSGSELRSFACHQTMCRLETFHQDRDRYRNFVMASFEDPATFLWPGLKTFSVPVGDEPGATEPLVIVSYVSQPEHSLPIAQ